MKSFGFVFALLASVPAFAHDEGHGPKLTDSPKQGGIVSSVINAKDASAGSKAAIVHKAELVRSEDGTVRVYLYDQTMKPRALTGFGKKAQAALETVKKGKATVTPFDLQLQGDAFVGKAPKAPSKPYNIEVNLEEGQAKLRATFENLD